MYCKLFILLLAACKIVLSHSNTNVFIKSEVPKPSSNATKVKTDNIKLLEKIIESKFKVIEQKELLIPIAQDIIDSWSFSENAVSDEEALEQIAASINAKVQPALKIIREICGFLTNKEHKRQVFYSLMNPCINDDKIDFRINHYYNEILHNNFSGEINLNILNDRNLVFHKILIENVGKADQSWQSYRQYFLSTSDNAKIENCNNVPDIPQFRRIYTSAISNRRVLLLLDQTSEQIDITRAIAKSVVSSLGDGDKVAIVAISNEKATKFPAQRDYCSTLNETPAAAPAMVSVTPTTKARIYDFLDNTNRTNGLQNHTLGFRVAFEVLDRLYKESNSNAMLPITFLYISDGVPALFSDARHVLAELSVAQAKLPHPVVINSCATIINSRQIPYQTQFLQDITSQSYAKYSINTSSWFHRRGDRSMTGKMFVVNRTMENLNKIPISVTTELFKYKNFINNQVTVHPPFYDAHWTNDFIVSITKNCDQRGIFGIDLFLNYLVEDILYSNNLNSSYKFLVDMKGFAVAHSKQYPRPVTLKQSFNPVHISILEKSTGFNEASWLRMRSEASGNLRVGSYSYTWSQISEILIVGIATNLGEQRPNVLHKIKTPLNINAGSGVGGGGNDQTKHLSELIYHHILSYPSSSVNMCLYYKQVATFDAISLHLSSKAFTSPYAHMKSNRNSQYEDLQMVQNFMAYLRDTRKLFANPGLLENIRHEVSGIYQIMEFFKKKHFDSELRKYAIRRYASSMNGVTQVYPGCMLDRNFEATRRPWFVKALESKGRIAITEPYLDAGGAGYIVSVSYAVYEKRFSSYPQSRAYQPVAVLSIDFTRGFFYKILLDSLPLCSYDDSTTKCFLMDDQGFLVAHPNILESSNAEHFRQPEHITHRESHVANDILMQRKFVEKIACNNYLNSTSQRFYQFNTSINEVISNFANVEKTKYQLMSLKGTNLFIGIINSSSETNGAFCPCSTVDFRCLNCFRMEQNECECPCECRLDEAETCTGENSSSSIPSTTTANNPMCEQQTEYLTSFQPKSPMRDYQNIEPCNLYSCDMFAEKEECLGVVGCIWCHTNDDETPLSIPFCASESTCYNGIFGSLGDYSNIVIDPVMNYNLLPPTYSIILPVIGVILLLFLVVGFAMYCYRINYDSNGFAEHLYDSQDNCIGMMQMSRFDYDEPPPLDDHQMSNNLNQSLLRESNENAIVSSVIQSPYRVATNYRHPHGYTDSSDHGYSTMGTHHDDSSEPHASSVSNRPNKRISLSDSASVNTSISSPQNTQPYDLTTALTQTATPRHGPPLSQFLASDQTILSPKKLSSHQIIAEVTVHRLMD